MSEGWKVPVLTYMSMIHGLKEEYSPHNFNVEAGMVVFRTKRERRLLEDVISWANDSVLPEREPVAGEPRKKKAKSDSKNGPSIGQLILQHPSVIVNLRDKNGEYLQGLCPSCAEIGKDSDENHFWIHESSGGYGCVADCMEGGDLTRALVKRLSDAGLLQNDTPQEPSEAELLAVRPIGKDPMSKEAAETSVVTYTTQAKRVLKHIHSSVDGVTDEEGQDQLDIPGNSYRPARVALVRLGFVKKSGKTRKTHSGSNANVWVSTMSPEQADLEWEVRKEKVKEGAQAWV